MQVARQVEIRLRTGDVLTIDVSDRLLSSVRDKFELSSVEQVTDRHLKYYLVSSMKNALEEADGREAH